MEQYFQKFPVITYENYQIRDISERVALITREKTAPFDFFPYELANELRPDQLAGAYYNDPSLDWIIFLVNNIVDPYYGWHLYDGDFNDYIIQKYGDLTTAFQTVAYWRTNWTMNNAQDVTVDYYAGLPDGFKKYFQPVFGIKNAILRYTRRQDDLTVNTNKIVQYNLTPRVGTFANGNLIAFNFTTTFTGQGEIISCNSTFMTVKNVYSSSNVFTGNTTSGTINLLANNLVYANIVSANTIYTDIPDIEGAFWEPVSYWDVENEKNENKRFIDVLGNNLVLETAETIRKALKVDVNA